MRAVGMVLELIILALQQQPLSYNLHFIRRLREKGFSIRTRIFDPLAHETMMKANNTKIERSGIATLDTATKKIVAAAHQERKATYTTTNYNKLSTHANNHCENTIPNTDELAPKPLSLIDSILLAMAQPQAVRVSTLAAITTGLAVIALIAIPVIAAVRHFQRIKNVPKPNFGHNISKSRSPQISTMSSYR